LKQKLLILLGLAILVAAFSLPADGELLSDCQRIEKQKMVGTDRVLDITYDCKMPTTGGIGVSQEGLTYQEKQILEKIRFEKLTGEYVQPPIQKSTQIDLQNPICTIVHFSEMLKQQYGCFD